MAYRISIGKDRHKFSAAHMTVFRDGTKERLHGHNFYVQVHLEVKDVSFASFLDFGPVKKVVSELCDAWDERLLLAEFCPHFKLLKKDALEIEFTLCGKRYLVPADEALLLPVDNIIIENLAAAFGKALHKRMKPNFESGEVVEAFVEIYETHGQGASYSFKP